MSIAKDQPELPSPADLSETGICAQTTDAYPRRITRDEIKTALNKIYAEETKPVNVRSIKNRSALALSLIIIGGFLIGSVIAYKYLLLEPTIMLIGLILVLTTFPIGFLISTKYIRKIYSSMSRFKNMDIPSYRRAAPSSRQYTNGLVYAILLSLILLGAQATNFLVVHNDFLSADDNQITEESVEINFDKISLGDIIWGEARKDPGGQYYRKVGVEINNTQNYYSPNLVLELESWFAGEIYDTVNNSVEQPGVNFIDKEVRVHDTDDTSILVFLKYYDPTGEHILGFNKYNRKTDIYITNAEGEILRTTPFTKSITITVTVYNDGLPRAPESVKVIIYNKVLLDTIYRDSRENNETIKRGEFWETKFRFEIVDEESDFMVELKLDEKHKDEANVMTV
ncbi:hypothetical protein [[Eubacterium] cellulosolvens]